MALRRAGLLVSLALVTACGPGAAAQPYYHEDPLPYYLYVPEDRSELNPPPLFVGLLGQGGSALDCFDLWQSLAEDRDLALICPELIGGADLQGSVDAQRDLGTVLTDVYAQQTFQPRFFLAGFGDAGRFAMDYALQFPQVVSGVAVTAVDELPDPSTTVSQIPFLLALGEEDRERKAAVDSGAEAWRQLGLVIRVVSISGDDRRPSLDFARLAAELASQTSR